MPFSFIIILFVILSHPIKIYNQSFTFSHSFFASPPALPLFSSPIALICFTPPSFSLPYSLQLPLYHHWSIKIRFTGFFFPFSQIFFGSLLFVLWSDIPNRKFISELPIRRSIWATTDLLFTISQIPPSTHYKISFTGYFSPFFFALSPLFYDLTHRIGLVHHLCVPSALFWFCSSPCPWFSCSLLLFGLA